MYSVEKYDAQDNLSDVLTDILRTLIRNCNTAPNHYMFDAIWLY